MLTATGDVRRVLARSRRLTDTDGHRASNDLLFDRNANELHGCARAWIPVSVGLPNADKQAGFQRP